MLIATISVYAFYLYLLMGLVFALWFAVRGVAKVDPGMRGADWKLRLLLIPGFAALWPVLLRKYIKSNSK